ncbi:hypothetical protein [Actinoplanes rectilineatus]|uniref:hypothetical protein n=1 Tax=Actinoplanes rectilineatus TaxID=113571 RepID=UPI000B1A4C74|nr:hypothetical protein [Actinoplanes rectilineatus]
MHAYMASHQLARRSLLNTTGGLDDAHQFWPVRSLAAWTRGDHHRHSKTRSRPCPPALLAPGTGA